VYEPGPMLYLHGLGHFHPENELDNAFLESLDIGTNELWITSRVGIKNRRTVLPLDYIRQTRNKDLRADRRRASTRTRRPARAPRSWRSSEPVCRLATSAW
jgi:3-oxoacyl-[acyl-carrier-protein] synthase III